MMARYWPLAATFTAGAMVLSVMVVVVSVRLVLDTCSFGQ